jgi:very-short-patch-repair endonuclease
MLPYNRRLKTKARSLRTNPTDAELHLWHRLRRKQILGVQFYRQKPIGNYIADFYAPAAKLVVELDGAQQLEIQQAKYDIRRTRDLEQRGLKILRFDDRQALLQTEAVLEAIFQAPSNSPTRLKFRFGHFDGHDIALTSVLASPLAWEMSHPRRRE